jgi:hypothetical protein
MKKLTLILTLLISIGVLAPAAFAAPDPNSITSVVSCGRVGEPECGFNDLILLVSNGISFLIKYIIIPIIILVFLRAGVMMIISKDKASEISTAKKSLWNAIVGLFFILTAWLIVSVLTDLLDVNLKNDPSEGVYNILGR